MTDAARTYEIQEVAELTGLEPSRLRVWERRYAAVRPARQRNGYRAYSAEQVTLLRSYARLIAAGERIGDLVAQPAERIIARAEGRDLDGTAHAALLDAVRALDRDRLEALVAQQIALRGLRGFAEEVALPLGAVIGDLWALARLPVAAEHLASEVAVHALKTGLRGARAGGPLAVAACLPGERHEWGILATLTAAQDLGWRVHYLGADLPVAEALEAAWQLRPRLLVLSASRGAVVHDALASLGGLPGRLPPGSGAAIGGSGTIPHAELLRTFGFRMGADVFAAG